MCFWKIKQNYTYLLIDLVYIYCFPVRVSAWVEGTHKFIVVNESITVHIKYVSNSSHFQGVCGKFCSYAKANIVNSYIHTTPWCKKVTKSVKTALTRSQNIVNELLVSDSAILISINATKDIQNPGFEVTYPLHVSFPPDVEVKISKLLQLPKRRFLDNCVDSNRNPFFYQGFSHDHLFQPQEMFL